MAQLFAPTLADQITCVRREITLRRQVYPRRVAQGRLSQAAADRELEVMRAVLETLETLPPEDPTPEMIEAGVMMHRIPRSGPDETLVHDIWQSMYDAWQTEKRDG